MHQKMNYLQIALVLYLLSCSVMKQNSGRAFGSNFVFPVKGNVYPDGNYKVTINLGSPPKPYTLDIDTGSDLTWVQCAPCLNCYPGPHDLYNSAGAKFASCKHPICISLQALTGGNPSCSNQKRPYCDYIYKYVDSSATRGVLIGGSVSLTFTNGTPIAPSLIFGCGYDQVYDPNNIPKNDGILGLGKAEPSIINQLYKSGVITQRVVGHCLRGDGGGGDGGGGFIFFGDHGDITRSLDVIWQAISPLQKVHYYLGLAAVQYDGEMSDISGLQIVFDSGSTYTYLASLPYDALVDLIKRHLDPRLIETKDPNLPLCWKGPQNFKTISEIVAGSYFKTWALIFAGGPNARLQMDPQNYLIVTNMGNVCLGILNGGDIGLKETSVIGDISLQDKLVIYDNELKQVGWAKYDCSTTPKN